MICSLHLTCNEHSKTMESVLLFLTQYAETMYFQHVCGATITILHMTGQKYPKDDKIKF